MKHIVRVILAFALACAAQTTGYTQEQLRTVCQNLAPDPEASGFVCLEVNSPQYLRCHGPELVWVLMDCSPPLRCVSPVMVWNESDPCYFPLTTYCGDGQLNGNEQCDGGANCAPDCTCEPGYQPTSPMSVDCMPIPCGNGVIDEGEQCDGGLGCNADCMCEQDYQPTDPVSVDCRSANICGDSNIDEGEQCEIGGLGCSASCTCEQGYIPTNPISTDCMLNPCGNGVIDGNEQCDGGLGCNADCTCMPDYQPTNPVSADCELINTCGNGVVDGNEQCDGGIGCNADCTCMPDYQPTNPPTVDCTQESRPYTPERNLCEWFTNSVEDAGFVCLEENSTEYLRCHLLEQVATMMSCPAGTRCRAPVDMFTVYNPCLWEAPFPVDEYLWIYDGQVRPIDENPSEETNCGNGVLDAGEQCEKGGIGCTLNSSTCVCAEYYRPTTPVSVDCELDYDAVCAKLFADNQRSVNYFCPASLFSGESSVVVRCDEATATISSCDPNTFCASSQASETNPCQESLVDRCGNGVLNAGEECDGGLGCNENCTCSEGYVPASPATLSCLPVTENETINYSGLCNELGGTGFFCLDAIRQEGAAVTNNFAWCVNGAFIAVLDCPYGTVCGSQELNENNPCVLPNKCGNGIIEGDEQCEVGGYGCDPETCMCEPGFAPLDPVRTDCKFTDTAALCSTVPEGATDNYFGCIENAEDYFVLCPGDGTQPVVEQCPRGTKCANTVFSTETPCQ